MSIPLAANIIGMLGTMLIVGAYVLMQINQLDPKGIWFNLVNLLGAIFLVLSLLVHFNLASLVMEIFWIAASLIGVYSYWRSRRRDSKESR